MAEAWPTPSLVLFSLLSSDFRQLPDSGQHHEPHGTGLAPLTSQSHHHSLCVPLGWGLQLGSRHLVDLGREAGLWGGGPRRSGCGLAGILFDGVWTEPHKGQACVSRA